MSSWFLEVYFDPKYILEPSPRGKTKHYTSQKDFIQSRQGTLFCEGTKEYSCSAYDCSMNMLLIMFMSHTFTQYHEYFAHASINLSCFVFIHFEGKIQITSQFYKLHVNEHLKYSNCIFSSCRYPWKGSFKHRDLPPNNR